MTVGRIELRHRLVAHLPLAAMHVLPGIDEHAVEVDAPLADAWAAVLDELDVTTSGRIPATYARAIGCEPSRSSGARPLAEGSTVPGFAVASAVPEEALVLSGRHRFSTYELAFRLRPSSADRTEVRAESRAVFPGVGGRLYELVVIRTGFHVRAVRRLLDAIRRRAEGPARPRPT